MVSVVHAYERSYPPSGPVSIVLRTDTPSRYVTSHVPTRSTQHCITAGSLIQYQLMRNLARVKAKMSPLPGGT